MLYFILSFSYPLAVEFPQYFLKQCVLLKSRFICFAWALVSLQPHTVTLPSTSCVSCLKCRQTVVTIASQMNHLGFWFSDSQTLFRLYCVADWENNFFFVNLLIFFASVGPFGVHWKCICFIWFFFWNSESVKK